jgi:predicted PurR-regulated permease PerM
MSDVVRNPAVETLEAARANAERQERALKVSFGEREPVEPGLHASSVDLSSADLYVTEETDKEPLGYITAPPLGPTVPVPMIQPRATYLFGWSRGDIRRGVLLLITTCVVVVFLYHVQAILPPFLIAFGLAALLDPTLRYNEQRGRSRVYSICMLYLLALSLLIFLVIWVIPGIITQVTDISSHLSHYYSHIQTTINDYMIGHERLLKMMGVKQQSVGDFFEVKSGTVQAHIGAVLGSVSGLAQALLARVIWLVIIPVASFFFMRDFPLLRARLIALFPSHHHARIDQMSHEIVDVFTAYLRGLAKICALYACVAGALFGVLNVQYALLLGIMAGLFYAIPYVGNVMTAVSAATLAYLMDQHQVLFWSVGAHSLAYAVIVAICCVVMANIIFDQIVYPRVVGASVGLHPVVSIFSLMAGATLFGIWGMLLATPVAASLQIVLMCLFPKLAQKPPASLVESPVPTT